MTENIHAHVAGRSLGRVLKAAAIARGRPVEAAAYAEGQHWIDRGEVVAQLKASVSATSAPLNIDLTRDFFQALARDSLVSRLTLARRVAPNAIVVVSGGTAAAVVTEGEATPVSLGAITQERIPLLKIVGLVVLSNEALDALGAEGEAQLGRLLTTAVARAEDAAVVADFSSGATTIASAGTTLANIDTDLKAAVDALVAAGGNLDRAVWLFPALIAGHLALLRGSGGAPAFPDIGAVGGTLLGIPVITSSAFTGSALLVDQGAVLVATGEVQLGTSSEGAIEMNTTPQNPTTSSVVVRSLWQENLVAARAMLWRGTYATAGSVVVLSGVAY